MPGMMRALRSSDATLAIFISGSGEAFEAIAEDRANV
jgi:hypothetical protein